MEANETEASLDQALTVLRGGVQRRPDMEPALRVMETWEQRLAASGSAELTPIGDDLAELRTLLLAGDPDPAAVGGLLASLADRVQAVAQSDAGAPVAERLLQLSTLLREQGDVLAGR